MKRRDVALVASRYTRLLLRTLRQFLSHRECGTPLHRNREMQRLAFFNEIKCLHASKSHQNFVLIHSPSAPERLHNCLICPWVCNIGRTDYLQARRGNYRREPHDMEMDSCLCRAPSGRRRVLRSPPAPQGSGAPQATASAFLQGFDGDVAYLRPGQVPRGQVQEGHEPAHAS